MISNGCMTKTWDHPEMKERVPATMPLKKEKKVSAKPIEVRLKINKIYAII